MTDSIQRSLYEVILHGMPEKVEDKIPGRDRS